MITVLFSTLISSTFQKDLDTEDFTHITSWKLREDSSYKYPSKEHGWVRGRATELETQVMTFSTADDEFLELDVVRQGSKGIELQNAGPIALEYHLQEFPGQRWLREIINPKGRHKIYAEEPTWCIWAIKADTHSNNNHASPIHA
ncbi:hypothetical protein PCANC_01573 [Puccinia coronata f. sp. avenae]|uniref:Uncharacterized protein n=1 Tax=Puccinia coronata f. sp. avenae TaxID=200324 RepID=A0A2N5UFJ8_9BASI|nr:hypothetical protein PCASD_06421 [Puccinia coronata f. sp. avenae]PLW55782.1 hypothetical protein PCANC_01573 [Puccinia coronata f. sp. avenae]